MKTLQMPNKQMKSGYIFTSESVSDGHTDKICDQISDAILDAYLMVDKHSRVACETIVTANRVILAGEIHSRGKIEVETIVRELIKKIGYTDPSLGFDHNCIIDNYLHPLGTELINLTGAGDQGMMFGYACSQTKSLMPIPIELANKLLLKLAEVRKNGSIPFVLPDAKSQVSIRYLGRKAVGLETLVISVHHQKLNESKLNEMRQQIEQFVVNPCIDAIELESNDQFETKNCRVIINPTGFWTDGGPAFDAGLTGRKTAVDTYGSWIPHGGGAFSGKDPSKVDRSAAYMARHIAKSVVASGLATECLIQISFVINDQKPVSLMVDTHSSGIISDSEIQKLIVKNFDLTAKGIIDYLELLNPIYLPTAAYGHFGREGFSWEKVKIIR